MKEELNVELRPVLDQIRAKASGLVVRGIIEALIGGGLTALSYNSDSPGGTYILFGGLLMVGIWNFFKGIYYLCNPKGLLKNR